MSRIIGIICSLIMIISGLYCIIYRGDIDGTVPALIGTLSFVVFILADGKPHNFDRNIK